MRISVHALTFCVVERPEQYSPSSSQAKVAKMVEHGLPGWETARQVAPRTARTEHIQDGVENAAEGITSCSTIALGSTHILLQALPLGIREVAWIGRIHAEHCSLLCCCLAYKTRSQKNREHLPKARARRRGFESPKSVYRYRWRTLRHRRVDAHRGGQVLPGDTAEVS
jgi:hypothetical protein